MKRNEIAYAKWASLAGPPALLAAAGAAGLGSWMMQGASLPLRSAVSLAAVAAVLGAVWLYRNRAARRHVAVLNAYAEKELDRVNHRRLRSAPKGKRRFSHSAV